MRIVERRAAPAAPGALPIWRKQAGVGKLLGLSRCLDVRTDHTLDAAIQPQVEGGRLDIRHSGHDRQPVAVGYPDQVVNIRSRQGPVLAIQADGLKAHLSGRFDGPEVLIGEGKDQRCPAGTVRVQNRILNHRRLPGKG